MFKSKYCSLTKNLENLCSLQLDLLFCKEYDVKSGYKYSNFFHIDSFKPSQHAADAEETIINVKLFVLATKDAHILLSPTDQIKSSPIYEIGANSILTILYQIDGLMHIR